MAARGKMELGRRRAVVAWKDSPKLRDMVRLGLEWRGKQYGSNTGGFGENPEAADGGGGDDDGGMMVVW